MSNLHLATRPETPSRLRPRPRRIRIPLAILGLLLVVACALGFGTILTQVGRQYQVLVLSHPVGVGDVITASDLGLATVSTGTSGIAFITVSNESTVIGRPAAVAMPAGAPLIAADLGSLPPPAGQAVVAVLIKPGDAPPSLAAGAAVWVVITTPETQSTGPSSSPATAPVAATVTAVDTPSDTAITQGVIVSLSLPSSDVQTVTTAAAAGNVSLALVPPGELTAVDIVPLVAAKGSAGVTTAALTLAAVWPEGRGAPVVVECDPGGGDVAARFGLEVIPGVVSLAAELERSGPVAPAGPGEQLGRHTQELPGGLRVLVAPTSPEEMRLPLDRLAEDLPRLALGDVDLVVDCGRLEASAMRQRTAVLRLIQRCGLMVVVVRPELAALQHLNVWLPTLRSLEVEVLALLSGRGPYSAEEIGQTMDLRVIGSLPHDPAAADVVGGASGSQPDRSPLFRAARPASAAIAAVLGRAQSATLPPTPVVEAVP